MLYFDGFSASKQGGGVLDLQNVIIYGEARGGEQSGAYGDIERGKMLCAWGKEYGIEGFVREEATYEVGLADTSRPASCYLDLKLIVSTVGLV